MTSLPKFQDIYRPGRVYREWTRLAPEYNEQLHVTRRDYSAARTFVDSIQIFFNWRIWKGLYLQKASAMERHSYCNVAVPFTYKLKYDYHGMGQHHSLFEFWFLNVLYLKWFRSRRIETDVAVRFKQRFGKEVFRYAEIQVKEDSEKRKQAASV